MRELTIIPYGLDKVVMKILSYHVGRDQAISRDALVDACKRMGFKVQERLVRQAINGLRKGGEAICSAGGEDGGYWLAENWDELNEYLEREVHSRAMDLLEQERAMKQEAEKRWGQYSRQFRLEI